MKELSIEEKAKRYDEAIRESSKIINHCAGGANIPECVSVKATIEQIFPELKESEDEKIRKAIYNCVNWFGFDSCYFKDITQEECLAWLERQGKQNLANSAKTCKDEKIREWLINLVKGHIEWMEDRIKEQLSNGQFYGRELNEAKDVIAWLKSLRPQNRWKPSDEQMEALKGVLEGAFRLDILESLYNDLLKLKE